MTSAEICVVALKGQLTEDRLSTLGFAAHQLPTCLILFLCGVLVVWLMVGLLMA